MSRKQSILKGTFILTATGFATRIIGFFYRMFLSHTFGEENVGLYQLIFPVYALCFSLTAAGFQTAISRTVAHKVSLDKPQEARQIVKTGLLFSVSLSILAAIILQQNADMLSLRILGDARCTSLLVVVSYALPFAAIHSCICGYYLGLRQTQIPAVSQFVEQIIRVCAVFVIYQIALKKGTEISISFAVAGLVFGEISSAFYCINFFSKSGRKPRVLSFLRQCSSNARELILLALPLTANRVLLNLLQSVEAISIPLKLQQYGLSSQDALKMYGVLTGMALPLILFPSAITNSVSTMLLPAVTELTTTGRTENLKKIIRKVAGCCFVLGFACCILFLLLGNLAGTYLFRSDLAGDFIVTMAWICPFLYMNSTLISILNGLGKATTSFFINTAGLLIRICGIWFVTPQVGIKGYLWGLLLSQLIVTVLCIFTVRRNMKASRA